METYFAPAKRTERRKFKNQIATVSHNPIISALLDAMTGILIVLNEDRQVVALNHGLLKAFGIVDAQSVLGLRVGEVLSCTHAEDPPNGCGTTPHCMTCGAAIAMMAAADGKTSEQICALTREDDNGMNDVCLQVRVKPITLEATPKGGEIQLTVRTDTHSISWDVWNSAPIPEKIQQRIFQRYFSTKSGSGRGLGTYSMKLFGEKYLKGKISFSTSIETGTVFTFTLPLK